MIGMTGTAKLAAALAAFQAEMPTVAKNKTAKVPTKSGGSYSYDYADLADVTQAAMPILAKHGLSFTCLPDFGGMDPMMGLTGTLLHTSGETLVGRLPIRGNSPQEIGSALTYMRRYLLGCMTGIVTDADDDGKLATNAAKKATTARRSKPDDGPPVAPPRETGELASPEQVRKIVAMMNERGMTIREDVLGYLFDVTGRHVDSRKELTKREASQVIDALESPLGDRP